MADTVDVDLDALVPTPKRVRLAGKVWELPGDLPMELFLRTQAYEQRIAGGEPEVNLVRELNAEILELFRVHQPGLERLPAIGLVQMMRALGQIYGPGAPPGEATPPNRAARRQRTRTASPARARPAAT
jgi:hypothetical protein